MPVDRRLYPTDWATISRAVREERAQGQCECMGECGLHRTHPGPRRCQEKDRQPARWARGTVVLTVAHLCHTPSCTDLAHLRAMCNRCHLRYDMAHHRSNAARTRLQRLEQAGQQRLFT